MRWVRQVALSPTPCLLICVQDADGVEAGVAGSMELLASRAMSTQPIAGFDWSPDKEGLFCCAAFDQCIRVGIVTKLNKV